MPNWPYRLRLTAAAVFSARPSGLDSTEMVRTKGFLPDARESVPT